MLFRPLLKRLLLLHRLRDHSMPDILSEERLVQLYNCTNFCLQYLIPLQARYRVETKILTITKSHNCVVNLQKLTRNNMNIVLGSINAYTELDQIPSICSEDIEGK